LSESRKESFQAIEKSGKKGENHSGMPFFLRMIGMIPVIMHESLRLF
jgi:hypothetical protein